MNIFNRNFGCEFEYTTSFKEIELIITKIIRTVYKKNNIKIEERMVDSVRNKKWHLKLDGSTGCELVTPISKIANLNKILIIVDYLKQNKVKITTSDSIHVHIEAKNISMKKIIVAWMQIENFIMHYFKKHRQNNSYCDRLVRGNKNQKIKSFLNDAMEKSLDHHAAISLSHYNDRKTVEFRLSHATFDPFFIEGWIKFCMYFLNYAKKINIAKTLQMPTNTIKDYKDIISLLKITDEKTLYFVEYHVKNNK